LIFFCGYSPERISPGDKINTLTKIKKVTSGSTPAIAAIVNNLYASIITAGTHLAPNIKVAEASKAIENAQRDINISFVNELALMFDKMGIDTTDVLAAASTKWNFLNYKPGLVGGHCIGVDPYYLAHKSEALGYKPEVILSGRRINDNMGMFVANKVIKMMINAAKVIKETNVLLLGFTFKENCPDVRNTKIVDVVKALKEYGILVTIFDPLANANDVKKEYNLVTINTLPNDTFDAIVLGVSHKEFLELNFSELQKENSLLYDVKGVLGSKADNRL
jgi:UDP-N-acetyl-D-galactosamine dehydrogenase